MMHQVISAVSSFVNPLLVSASNPEVAPSFDFTTLLPLMKLMVPPSANGKSDLPFDLKQVAGLMQMFMPAVAPKHAEAIGAQTLLEKPATDDMTQLAELANKVLEVFAKDE